MANYYNDNPNLDFYLDHPLMKRIVEICDVDEIKVFEPSLNDIFVEYAEAQV